MAKAFSTLEPSKLERTAPNSKPAAVTKNTRLLVRLKEVRLELAKERGVPAFVIFSDKTLIQMANELPTTESEFLSISGVGRAKFDEFYVQFSQVISSFKFSTE